MSKFLVLRCFGYKTNQLASQTVKTRNVHDLLYAIMQVLKIESTYRTMQ